MKLRIIDTKNLSRSRDEESEFSSDDENSLSSENPTSFRVSFNKKFNYFFLLLFAKVLNSINK